MLSLTAKQAELLDFIEAMTLQNGGVAPSYEEMKCALGLKSKSGIHRMVLALEERGHIRRLREKARTIEVVRNQDNSLAAYSIYELRSEIERRLKAA